MKTLQPTTQYRKDLKRYKNYPKKLAALQSILEMLKCDIPIPPEYSPHTSRKLQGMHGVPRRK